MTLSLKFYKFGALCPIFVNIDFMEIFRKIKQIFESLYWYRWRDYKGNELTLPDCWNGSYSIYKVIYDKLEHIMYAHRKYSDEMRRYLCLGPYDEMNVGEKMFIREYAKDIINCSSEKFIAGRIKCSEEISEDGYKNAYIVIDHGKIWLETSVQKLIDPKTIKKKDKLYVLKQDSDNFEFEEADQYTSDYHKVFGSENQEVEWYEEKLQQILNEKVNFYDTIFRMRTIDVSPEMYVRLPATFQQQVRGKVMSFHKMWQFRKMYNEFLDMIEEDFNPDSKEKKKQNKKFLECMKYLAENGDSWWF